MSIGVIQCLIFYARLEVNSSIYGNVKKFGSPDEKEREGFIELLEQCQPKVSHALIGNIITICTGFALQKLSEILETKSASQ